MALDAVPQGSLATPMSPPSLFSWLRTRAYSVVAASKKAVVLEGAAVDIGAVLLAESGLMLDQAQEHSIQCRHQLASGQWFSPAWMSVSLYYWAYFLVLALTRMTGRTPWFLTHEEVAVLKGLAPGSPPAIGPGPRIVTCGVYASATVRRVEIRQAPQTRLHDVVWRLWFTLIRDLVRPLTQAKSTTPELRLYLPQVLAANSLGDSWPTDYRNAVNYVPGLAYGAARGNTPTATFATVRTTSGLTVDEATDRLGSDAAAVVAGSTVRAQLPQCTRLLISLTFMLDTIAHSLFTELAQRRGIDKRWLAARSALARLQYTPFGDRTWPVALPAA
jgi:hypothetical protein